MTKHAAAEWTIGPERDQDGHEYQPVLEVQCRQCTEESPFSTEQGNTDQWAMEHAGLTGHRSFRENTTRHLSVQPAPTNPLYEQEREAAR